ncbi:hypothetical protein Tco_0569416 [Tanacetum coccineum]
MDLPRDIPLDSVEELSKISRVLRIILVILPEHQNDTKVFTVTMEILPKPTSNKLYGRSTDTPYPPVGYDVSTLLLRQYIDYSSLNNVSALPNDTTKPFDEERNHGAASEWFKKDCIGSVTTWEDLVEKFIQKFYQLSNNNEEMEADESDDPDDIAEIFKIEGNLFDYETPLCKAFNDFNYLLEINTDLFTFDIQGIRTYEEYELNNTMTRDLEEPWLDNGVLYQLSTWDGSCQMHDLFSGSQVDELADGKLKEETLMHKAKVEESWGDATPGVMKFCAWLKSSFENFHELDYNVLVKLEECWWKVNAHEGAPFTHWENYSQGPYAKAKTERAYNPYLDINHIFGRNYGADNPGYTQDNQKHKKEHHDPSTCRVRRFKMIKYSFDVEDEYVANKEHECSDHSKTNIDTCQAYRELFSIMDEGWLVTKACDE